MPICLQLVNKVETERITVFMRKSWIYFERKLMFFNGELRSSVRILHGSENLGFRCCATPIIMTSTPKFATYRVKVEQIILFVKITNRYFERKQCFSGHQFRSFDGGCENQGRKNFVLASCLFKAYCQLHRLAFTWLDAMMDIRVSG